MAAAFAAASLAALSSRKSERRMANLASASSVFTYAASFAKLLNDTPLDSMFSSTVCRSMRGVSDAALTPLDDAPATGGGAEDDLDVRWLALMSRLTLYSCSTCVGVMPPTNG